MERDELRTTLVNHLETLRRNLQIVSMEVLKTKYKKPFDALRQDICKAATAYTRFLVFDGMRIKHKYFDEAVPYIDTAVKQTKRLKQISDAAFQRQDIDEIESLALALPYKKFGATHPIQLQVTSYLNGNLAIQMVTLESGDPEPWATLTVNLPGQRQKDHAFIDTNADSEFPTWLIRHGLAIPTGHTMQSGFCTYPEYRFRANRLQELDPEGYAGYLKNFERRCSA